MPELDTRENPFEDRRHGVFSGQVVSVHPQRRRRNQRWGTEHPGVGNLNDPALGNMMTLDSRSRVVGVFPSEESYVRVLSFYLIEYSEDWWEHEESYIRRRLIN